MRGMASRRHHTIMGFLLVGAGLRLGMRLSGDCLQSFVFTANPAYAPPGLPASWMARSISSQAEVGSQKQSALVHGDAPLGTQRSTSSLARAAADGTDLAAFADGAASLAPAISVVVLVAAASSVAQLSYVFAGSYGSGGSNTGTEEGFFDSSRWQGRTLGIAAAWASLVFYALVTAPGKTPEAQEADAKLLSQVLSTPFDGVVSPLFIAIFNSLGIWPVIYAATLLPGAAKQSPVPAWPFVGGSFFLGAFALSPYLAIRKYFGASSVKADDLDWVTRNVLETRWNAVLMLGGATYLWLYAFGNGSMGSFTPGDMWNGFLPVFMSSLTAHVSSLDFLVLWMFYSPVLLEDGRRRGMFQGPPGTWTTAETSLFAFCAGVPVFGGGAWLLLRPQLENDAN